MTISAAPRKSGPRRSRLAISKPFTLTLGFDTPRITLSLKQTHVPHEDGFHSNGHSQQAQSEGSRRLISLSGSRARSVLPAVLEMLHRSGVSLARFEEKQGGRVGLPEAVGARLALLLLAVAPIQKPSRIALVKAGIAAMSDEEIYYWYAKAEGGSSESARQRRNNTLKALRILLAGE